MSMEQLGGARIHCSQSGLGDYLAANEEEALDKVREFFNFMPWHWEEEPLHKAAQSPVSQKPLEDIVAASQNSVFDMQDVIDALVDNNSWLELKALFARDLIVGLVRLGGSVVGVVANQPKVKGGVLFLDSADKGAWFIQLCTAYGTPLVFLQDISGFMVGSAVERQGIIRRGLRCCLHWGKALSLVSLYWCGKPTALVTWLWLGRRFKVTA